MLNPYQSENVESLKSAPEEAVPTSVDAVTTQFVGSRNKIALLSLSLGFFSAFCLFSIVRFLIQTDYAANEMVLPDDPMWMMSDFIKCICFGHMSYELWQYQRAIKFWTLADEDSTQKFAQSHARVWRAGEIFICVLMGYFFLSVAVLSFFPNA